MTTVHAHDRELFWSEAGALFEAATTLGELLSQSRELTPELTAQVMDLADGVPSTPEPLSDMDPYLRDALLTALIQAFRATTNRDRDETRIAVERVRQALRDLLDERPVWQAGAKEAAIWLVHTVEIPIRELEGLLGVSHGTVRRWANPQDQTQPGSESAERLVVLAKIVNHLRHAMTARGVVRWLQRPHPRLEGRSPVEQLKDAESYRMLIHLASGTRSMLAT